MIDPPREWVLLRGLARGTLHWGGFATALARGLGQTVHCIDLPGNGAHFAMRSPTTVSGFADWCHATVLERGIGRPFGIVAMSLGAMVAVDWICRHPRDIDAAVLINTSMRPFSGLAKRLRPENYWRILSMLAMPHDAEEVERTILLMTSNDRPVDDPVIEDWSRWRLEQPVSRRNVLAQLWAAARFKAPKAAPLERVLLLASEGDRLVHPDCSRQLASAWDRPLCMHPFAGHDLPLDDAPWVIGQVARWLDELRAAADGSALMQVYPSTPPVR